MQLRHLLVNLQDYIYPLQVPPDTLSAAIEGIVVAHDPDVIPIGNLIAVPPLPRAAPVDMHTIALEDALRVAEEVGAPAVLIVDNAHSQEALRNLQEPTRGPAILGVAQHQTWSAAWGAIMDALVHERHEAPHSADGTLRDLFDLADTTSRALGGHIAIMDQYGWVIAYSTTPGQSMDKVRADGILNRRVPNEFAGAHLDSRHWQAGEVRELPPRGEEHLARIAAPIRAGAAHLGSVWGIVSTGSVSATMHDEIRGAAEIAASHMVRYTTATSARAWTEEDQRLHAILTNPASEADLPIGDTMQRVVAVIRVQRDDVPATEIDLQRVRILARVILSGPLQLGAIVVGQRLFVTIPGDSHTPAHAEQAIRALQVRSLESLGLNIAAGVSAHVERISEGVEQARAALEYSDPDQQAVTMFETVRFQHFVGDVGRLLRASELRLPVAEKILEHDATHGTFFARSVLSIFRHRDNMAAAATALHIHPNSLRYRLRRCQQLFDLDLTDPDQRLALWLQLDTADRLPEAQ